MVFTEVDTANISQVGNGEIALGIDVTGLQTLYLFFPKNTYKSCGINGGGPSASTLPGNGGLLYAVAMVAAGWDGAPENPAPGFPDVESWNTQD